MRHLGESMEIDSTVADEAPCWPLVVSLRSSLLLDSGLNPVFFPANEVAGLDMSVDWRVLVF